MTSLSNNSYKIKFILLSIKSLILAFTLIILFKLINYLSGIIFVLQHKYLPWNIQHSQYQFSKYILALYNNLIPATQQYQVFKLHFISFVVSTIIVTILLTALYLYIKATFFHNKDKRKTHGNAQFSTMQDIIKADLFNANLSTQSQPSIILGKFQHKFLYFKQSKFVALAAPTRAGKGVGIVIPNLLHWNSSVVCLDIKGENFEKTSGYRATFTKVFKFDPFSLNTHRFNPLSTISRNPYKTISDIQSIARILWPLNDKEPIWNDSSCNLFQGLILFLLEYMPSKLTMEQVLNLANDIGLMNINAWQEFQQKNNVQLSKSALNALNAYFSLPQETRTSVLGTFNAQMQIFNNPVVAAATCADDFNLQDIRTQKISIYICISPNRLSQASKLLNIFFSQLIQLNTEELPEQNLKLKETALILLDEFTALGKVEIIEKAISYIAGYGLRLLLIYQSQSQLSSVYGQEAAQNIITNCGCQILFAPREQKDAEEYSKILGNTTINVQNYSYNQGGNSPNNGGKNININQQERALMLPQELKYMGIDSTIIIIENCKPIKASKIKYYNDKAFIQKLMHKV